MWYSISMSNPFNTIRKVNADIRAQREHLKTETCPIVRECIEKALAENVNWIEECRNQNARLNRACRRSRLA
jgi:hypothetical protein